MCSKATKGLFRNFLGLVCISGLLFLPGCENKTDYQLLVEKELASGVRYDTLFLGYYFGMSREDFFEHSWNLNKQELVSNGNGAEIKQDIDGLKAKASRVFYPEFKDEKIFQMPVRYSYTAWAPWNRGLWADSLILDLKDKISEEYDISFISVEDTVTNTNKYFQVTGNLQINISEVDHSTVLVEFIDLSQVYRKS